MCKAIFLLLFMLSAIAVCENPTIEVYDAFDSGLLPAQILDWPLANKSNIAGPGSEPLFKIENGKVVFDMSINDAKKIYHTHCLIKSSAPSVLLEFKVCPKRVRAYAPQGLYISPDGNEYKAVPYTVIDDSTFQVKTDMVNGQLFVATDLPYGRNMLEKLIIETSGKNNWKMLSKDNRPVVLFELGKDDGKKPIHYLWAEDACETGGAWLVDSMIRVLHENSELAQKLADKAVIRICPTISPYSLGVKSSSYTSLDGKSHYGAAGWNKMPLYPELAIMTDMFEKTISEKRLGFVMTFHCSYSAIYDSEVETIKSAGENTLSQERADWALATMNAFMDKVKRKNIKFPDTCWSKGLLREYSLSKYNAITFRIEVSTYEQDYDSYQKMAETMLTNLAKVDNWTPVLSEIKK